jgi:hypothetical protein
MCKRTSQTQAKRAGKTGFDVCTFLWLFRSPAPIPSPLVLSLSFPLLFIPSKPANAFLVINYLKEIAKQYKVNWEPSEDLGQLEDLSQPVPGALYQHCCILVRMHILFVL